jgi:hypothetical protein
MPYAECESLTTQRHRDYGPSHARGNQTGGKHGAVGPEWRVHFTATASCAVRIRWQSATGTPHGGVGRPRVGTAARDNDGDPAGPPGLTKPEDEPFFPAFRPKIRVSGPKREAHFTLSTLNRDHA